MRVDASRTSTLVTCACGFRVPTAPENVRTLMDRHRATHHPRQATYVESKRRARSRAGTVAGR